VVWGCKNKTFGMCWTRVLLGEETDWQTTLAFLYELARLLRIIAMPHIVIRCKGGALMIRPEGLCPSHAATQDRSAH